MTEASHVLGNAGIAAVLLLWTSPIYDLFLSRSSVLRLRSTKQLATGFNYIASLFSCLLWVMYTCNRTDMLMESFFVNVLGLGVNAIMVACYWYFAQTQQRFDANVQLGFLSAAALAVGLLWLYLRDNAFVGYVAIVLNLLMYFGPFFAVKEVCKTKSTSSMPLAPVVMTLITSAIWTAYGVEVANLPILIPNVGGIGFGVTMLLVWLYVHCCHRPLTSLHDNDDDNDDGIEIV
ncbi:hypothetical protein BASA81_006819 [Batrachochytrium salamandrivorans]|nr:hypothetical protein BASA81_006819 [Batrachochytrium salamandrivorans]